MISSGTKLRKNCKVEIGNFDYHDAIHGDLSKSG